MQLSADSCCCSYSYPTYSETPLKRTKLPLQEVYGFDMTPIAAEVRKGELETAGVHVVKPSEIITEDVKVKELDLCTMRAQDQDFTAEFTLTSKVPEGAEGPAAAASAQECHAIVLWFDTDFSSRFCAEAPVKLTTSWRAQPTHWAQTVLVLKEPVLLSMPGQAPADGTAPCITGRLSMVRNRFKHRFLDISLEYKATLGGGKQVHQTAMYSMSVSGKD
jgi:protein arginine N-methyltransferase 3